MQDGPAIFISYRRRDAGGHARALYEYLSRRFGRDRVFFDRSTIESGDAFPDTLRRGVEGCAALVALIGPEWLEIAGDDSNRRLENADDFVRQEIALALETGKKVIPLLVDDTPAPSRDRLPDPLKELASRDALTLRGKTYEYETQRRELVRLLANVPGVPQPRPDTESDSTRYKMLAKIRNIWIDGYLKHSLHHVVRIELCLHEQPAAVSRPWDLIVQQPDRAPRPLPHSQAVSAIFDELGQALLILGAPGSGKTTLLLELARDLLDRADQDDAHPLPVVFHLSSWAVRRRSLDEWLVEELVERYSVSRKLAQAWTDAENIIPLLDGLDEIALEHRPACVAAINVFRSKHALVPLVVCSRAADYQALPVRVELSGAIVIEPLSRVQIRRYLKQAGKSLAGVRTALRDDETLWWELLETPLMLSIVALAYQGRSAAQVRATGSLEQRRTHLFENYTRRMFERRSRVTEYTPEQTICWLTWLARSLMRNNLSIFYVELTQPDWLPSRAQRCIVAITPVIFFGLFFSLFVMLSGQESGLFYKLYQGLLAGLIVGPAGGLVAWLFYRLFQGLESRRNRIRPAEALRWSWRKVRRYSVVGLVFGLLAGLGFGLLEEQESGLVDRLYQGLLAGLGFGLLAGLVFGLLAGLTTDQLVTRIIPNEGIRRSLRNALISFVTVWPVIWLVFGLLVGQSMGPAEGLLAGLVFGLLAGLVVGLVNGGSAYLKHYMLRFLLWRNNYAPRNYIRFLDYAAERVFLRKVGGGYTFTHRLLTEYFATLQPIDRAGQTQNA